MQIEPVTLIDQTIVNLETLSALFADEFVEPIHDASQLTRAGQLCLEAHATIRDLLPKLRAARCTQEPSPLLRQRPECVDCD